MNYISIELLQQRLYSFYKFLETYDVIDIFYIGYYAEITVIENKILKCISLKYKYNIDLWVEISRKDIKKV